MAVGSRDLMSRANGFDSESSECIYISLNSFIEFALGALFMGRNGRCSGVNSPSKSFNLEEELQEALSQNTFSFKGDYHHAALHLSAPNPCLAISGLGPVGLPFLGHYAKDIIASAGPSYPGAYRNPGEKTIPGSWEIEASRLSFLNPAWEIYVSKTLCPEVYEALDISASACQLQLDRLLIYEEGSLVTFSHCHFDNYSSDESLQNSAEVFASVVFLLPSAYTGGQMTLSHASRTTTVDFSSQSAYASAVLAWYTEAILEVEPISSGYCLALRYNLVHTPASTKPCPSLPDTSEATMLLRGVLGEWRKELDHNDGKRHRMGYILDHTYDLKNMKGGIACLKGADAHRVRLLHEVGEDLGLILCFASTEPNSVSKYRQDRRLEQLTDLEGNPLFGLTKHLELPRKSVVEITESSWKTVYGYGYNSKKSDEGTRTVLLLINAKSLDELRHEVDGLEAALQMLRERAQTPPTPDNIKWAKVIAAQKKNIRDITTEMFTAVLDYAIDWQDLELWIEMTDCYKWKSYYVKAESLLRARKTFSFEKIRDRIEVWILESTGYRCSSVEAVEVITLVYDLLSQAPTDDEQKISRRWCKSAVRYVLRSYMPQDAEEAATALKVLDLVGLELFKHELLPRMKEKTNLFDFWMSFYKSLNEQRPALLQELVIVRPEFVTPDGETASSPEPPSVDSPTKAELLDELILATLSAASSTWAEIPPLKREIFEEMFGSDDEERAIDDRTPKKIERILLTIEHCIRCGHMDPCDAVLVKALDVSGNPFWHFSEFFIPFLSRLRQLLESLGQDISRSPFANFIRRLISKYLSQVLGKPGPLVDIGLRRLGCDKPDCKACKELDAFILSTKTEICLHGDKNHRGKYHLQTRLGGAIDLCKYELDKSSYSRPLKITKHESVVHCSKWDYRLEGAKALLAAIGPEPVIASVMGERYGDVQDALLGRRKYVWDERRDAQVAVANSTASAAPAQDDSSGNPSPVVRSTRVLRSKRKRSES